MANSNAIIVLALQAMNSSEDSGDEDGEDKHYNEFLSCVADVNDDGVDFSQVVQIVKLVEQEPIVKIKKYVDLIVPAYSDETFTSHFRLRRSIAGQLAKTFQESENFRSLLGHGGFEAVSPEKHILAYLWFVGHNSSFRDISDRFDLSLSGAQSVVTRITNFIISIGSQFIHVPTYEEKESTKMDYLREKQVPGVLGSIDGSHIRIDKPNVDSDTYVNRKRYFSIHLQGVVNERRKFIDEVIGWPGSVHDARVFQNSNTKDLIANMCNAGEYVLGDSAYPCLPYLITPYKDYGNLTRAQKQFNTALSSCRVSVEHAFGILKQRFRILYFMRLRSLKKND
ncbi:unnamed protein product [Callosobruchus maculatus]|uniref:Putative nuclease HARBI1 n=1 Tax=Callosobruchus maculatus TaxID=64391 RepID=A0A653DTT4_CALMS|nr:unnamed protein product [Callosobruchus maculatus]